MRHWTVMWSLEIQVEAENKTAAEQKAREDIAATCARGEAYDVLTMLADSDPLEIVETDEDGEPLE